LVKAKSVFSPAHFHFHFCSAFNFFCRASPSPPCLLHAHFCLLSKSETRFALDGVSVFPFVCIHELLCRIVEVGPRLRKTEESAEKDIGIFFMARNPYYLLCLLMRLTSRSAATA
jgi:hypothetical protein